MLNTIRIAAIGAIVVLAGTLALVGGTMRPAADPAGVPGAAALPQHENVPFRVIGTSSGITMPSAGSSIPVDGILQIRGRVGQDEARANHPRVSGTMTYLHHADSMEDMGTEWGTMRVENDEGAWEGVVSGYFTHAETRTSGWLSGEDAYDGLTFEGEPPTDPPTFD